MPRERHIERPDRTGIQKRKEKVKKKLKAVIRVAIAFAFALLLISRFAVISEYNYNIRQLEKELEELQKTNERLSLQLAQAQDINWIEEYATNKLGMVYPDNRDIVFVAVEESQHDEEATIETAEKKSEGKYSTDGWVAVLIGKFNSIFR
jgi:cell division protein FtsB